MLFLLIGSGHPNTKWNIRDKKSITDWRRKRSLTGAEIGVHRLYILLWLGGRQLFDRFIRHEVLMKRIVFRPKKCEIDWISCAKPAKKREKNQIDSKFMRFVLPLWAGTFFSICVHIVLDSDTTIQYTFSPAAFVRSHKWKGKKL